MFRRLLLAGTLLCCTGCNQHALLVESHYISYEDLASYHVGSPDARKACPDMGQRLFTSWSLPKVCLDSEELYLRLQLRFGNREEKVLIVPIDRTAGMFTYSLLNEEFCQHNGILTYMAEIVADGEVIEEWRHQMWTQFIAFEEELPQYQNRSTETNASEEKKL